ncbi:MAG: ADP-ribosylglycohydrolase family protein [Rhodoferax sp.]|nr:ADP-ribosylglycohydrolase family protein [Rhodoferax sp.]MCF8208832.1 ADP-ribosylglycohydrolase family protein [Rhodoferax sp.]
MLAFSLYCAGFNFWGQCLRSRALPSGQRGPSPIVMVGGLFGMLGMLTLPVAQLRPWCWLPFVLDVGCLPLLIRIWLQQRKDSGKPVQQASKQETAVTNHRNTLDGVRLRAITGCLVGTAVGDAIGLPFEGLSRRRVHRWLRDAPLQHRFFFGHGCCSDDTEHACLVAQALLTARSEPQPDWFVHVFTHNLAWRLRFWLLGAPAGIGLATLKSLLKQWLHPLSHCEGVFSAGNGPAMRSAILGVCQGDDAVLMHQLVCASTRLTHTDPRAQDGALAVACAAHLAAQADPLTTGRFLAEFSGLLAGTDSALLPLLKDALASVEQRESSLDFAQRTGSAQGVSGFVMHTVPVALHIWLSHPQDFARAIETAVRCGGDTDTVGAIVGGLVGARVGPEGIPTEWRARLWEWPRNLAWLHTLGERLADSDPSTRWRGALRLSLTALLLRNMLFMVWVLAHGFRRLLPPW